ncbi:TPA: hypothetical protein ACN7VY_000738 [Klebsiella pneumoniae]|nr:hypothetical protein [Klebsiella pneumoniae]
MNNKTEFKFGDYAIIEQKRHGVPNDMFVHKVIDQLRSNTWVDVPVQSPATETMHEEMEDVCLCICCGVDETEVRRYRVKDMRRHSPVSAVTDEKKGSTITLQAVNELIASLESAGELSIREQKFLKLAKAFKQLAAENVAIRETIEAVRGVADNSSGIAGWHLNGEIAQWSEILPEIDDIETPATDRIVAGIKADGVGQAANECYGAGYICETLLAYAKQLREGADK